MAPPFQAASQASHCSTGRSCEQQANKMSSGRLLYTEKDLLKRLRLCACTGALAEVARELGRHMVPYVPKLLPIIQRELRCDMSDNRRNSAFAAGTLVSAAPEATSQHALNILHVSTFHRQTPQHPSRTTCSKKTKWSSHTMSDCRSHMQPASRTPGRMEGSPPETGDCCGKLQQRRGSKVRVLEQALQPLFQADEEPGTRDNAAGAVSRMILALGSHLPLEQVSCQTEM